MPELPEVETTRRGIAPHCEGREIAGVRVYDIRDHLRPEEVGACVPPAPKKLIDPRPNRPVVLHSADVFVDAGGLCYCTDWSGAGLYIMEYQG